jgi:hypothetical protein
MREQQAKRDQPSTSMQGAFGGYYGLTILGAAANRKLN